MQIIFVMGYSEYMSEGYDVAVLHCLMKLVCHEKLSSVLDRAVAGLKASEKRIRIVHDHRTDLIPVSQITYIEAQKQYILIWTGTETYRMKIFSDASGLLLSICGMSQALAVAASC